MSGDPQQQIEATARIRRLLSKEEAPPIEQVIRAGLIPYFVSFLQSPDQKLQVSPHLGRLSPVLPSDYSSKFESAWALTNVASGTSEQTQLIINNGAVPPLVKLLSSPSPEVREQAVWALGNIAGDGAMFRDYVLQSGVMEPLLTVIGHDSSSLNLVRNAVWTLSNLCRGKNPPPDWDIVSRLTCWYPDRYRLALFVGIQSVAAAREEHLFVRYGYSGRCFLGAFVSIRWVEPAHPSRRGSRGLPTSCRPSHPQQPSGTDSSVEMHREHCHRGRSADPSRNRIRCPPGSSPHLPKSQGGFTKGSLLDG